MRLWLWIFMLESSLSISRGELRDLRLQWSNFAVEGMRDNSGLGHSITHLCCILFCAIFINGFSLSTSKHNGYILSYLCVTSIIDNYLTRSILHCRSHSIVEIYPWCVTDISVFSFYCSTVVILHFKSSSNKLQCPCAHNFAFWGLKHSKKEFQSCV